MTAAAIATPSTARNPKPGIRFPEALDLSENLLNDAELPELISEWSTFSWASGTRIRLRILRASLDSQDTSLQLLAQWTQEPCSWQVGPLESNGISSVVDLGAGC